MELLCTLQTIGQKIKFFKSNTCGISLREKKERERVEETEREGERERESSRDRERERERNSFKLKKCRRIACLYPK